MALQSTGDEQITVYINAGPTCDAAAAAAVAAAFRQALAQGDGDGPVRVVSAGSRGFAALEPTVAIEPAGILYCGVTAADVPEIVERTLFGGQVIERLCYQEPESHRALPDYRELPFYRKQVRIILRNCGIIDPERIEDYFALDGYQGLGRALQMTPDDVIRTVQESGLRGRGGAGFNTGLKWEFARRARTTPKYVICNADEGDPGAFMDRSILEGDPHSVIEGMIIAGYAVGASEGYIYCRAEYPLAIARLKTAIAQARAYGLLGENILGSGFSFDLHLKEGAGAFVCGEEMALIASIEGRRGEPRPKPPFPAVAGLWQRPTVVNNVKSYALTSRILLNGAEWFRNIGTPKSPGTAVFALTGQIKNTGLIEVPMGITLREIIYDVGGGIPKKKRFKAVQTGGPLGGCLPAEALDTPVDFDSLTAAGATMGSGGMIVVDESTCMVEFAKYFLTFATAESCGKCVPCRIGGQRLLEVLTRITAGAGTPRDLDEIERISRNMREASLCALGQLTPGPVMSALRFFRAEYEAHVYEKFCPAGVCKGLYELHISEEKCAGCGLCRKACPQQAISGDRKQPHVIDQLKCIQCGACVEACNLDAIVAQPRPKGVHAIAVA